MKKSTSTQRVVTFLKSDIWIKTLLSIMTVFFIHQFVLLTQLLLAPSFSGLKTILLFVIFCSTGWIIHNLVGILKSKKAANNNTVEPIDNYINCLLKISKLETELVQERKIYARLDSYRKELTNTYIKLLTRSLFFKKQQKRSLKENEIEVQNRLNSLAKEYQIDFNCIKCGLSISSIEEVNYHSKICKIALLKD